MKIISTITTSILALITLVGLFNPQKFFEVEINYFIFVLNRLWIESLVVLLILLAFRFSSKTLPIRTKIISYYRFEGDYKIQLRRMFRMCLFFLFIITIAFSAKNSYSFAKNAYFFYIKNLDVDYKNDILTKIRTAEKEKKYDTAIKLYDFFLEEYPDYSSSGQMRDDRESLKERLRISNSFIKKSDQIITARGINRDAAFLAVEASWMNENDLMIQGKMVRILNYVDKEKKYLDEFYDLVIEGNESVIRSHSRLKPMIYFCFEEDISKQVMNDNEPIDIELLHSLVSSKDKREFTNFVMQSWNLGTDIF